MSSLLPKIEEREKELAELDNAELRKESLSLRYRSKSGERLMDLLPEAYALVREAAARTVNMRHFDVQVMGGIALARGAVAEMETGEGKTLTATLPLYLYALSGKGAHLATVNDYLAERDANLLRPVYELLGMTVGVIQSDQQPAQRKTAYACDVTYGTAKEFGFDFLRDRLALRQASRTPAAWTRPANSRGGDGTVRRGAHFVLVDEADSILIDEASTPLIIGTLDSEAIDKVVKCYRWTASEAEKYVEDTHFDYDHEKKSVELTAAGRELLRSETHPVELNSIGLVEMYEYMERAIKVSRDFHLDREYVVRDGEIVIVDEFTGRMAEGRKWRDGIHQAIEAKEEIEVTVPTGQAARITVQDLFLLYRHLAGMTGTARTSAREFRKVYRMAVQLIPTNKPVRRQRLNDRVYSDSESKWNAVVDEIKQLHEEGRPVLIGTRSIDKSETLSQLLDAVNIEHRVLNARNIALEAEIVAQAGQRANVTVATNMAGRGTDIKLQEGIAELGGLQVICTELHDSARIDRQLAGRCGRQGDPGTFRQYMALDDDILENAFGPQRAANIASVAKQSEVSGRLSSLFRRAQRRVEAKHLRGRMMLLHHEKQRKKVQREMGQDPYLDTPD
jgi:preprotein translocase subunit SecA